MSDGTHAPTDSDPVPAAVLRMLVFCTGATVLAIEIARSGVRDFKKNIEINKIQNVELLEGAVEKKLPEAVSTLPADSPITVLVDPPRTGLETGVIPSILQMNPQKIVYVSCDPATLARDAKPLLAAGYELGRVTPVDLFPQTYHIESVSAFAR